MTKLCFSDGRPFRILTLQSLDADDQNAEAVSEKLAKTLDETKPDLLLLDGDVTAGIKSEIALHGLLSALLSPVEARKIPFAHTFGDLDASAGLPLEAQMAIYRSFSGCLSESGPDGVSGVGNYSLFIYGGDGSPRFLVWCLDSHRGVGAYEAEFAQNETAVPVKARLANPLYSDHYNDGVRFNQTMWYHQSERGLEETLGRKLPGAMFFHIPAPEHVTIPMNAAQTGMRGRQKHQIKCQCVGGGIFSAVYEHGGVRAIIAGHGTENCFWGDYAGVTLAQCPSFEATGSGLCADISPDGSVDISEALAGG